MTAPLVGLFPSANAATPDITVTVGQALQLKGQNYGVGAVDGLTHDLARTVGGALSRARTEGSSQVQLVLQDASPSRTVSTGASLGGAWIDGFVIGADGKKTPLGFSYYQAGLGSGGGAWTDAHRAFALLASDLARGRIPQQAVPGNKPITSQAHYPD